jgi:LmbE family N-acetylglucosaminyl deacetylase
MVRVLAVGAHPDDIEFGCGGTLARHRDRGDAITAIVISDGALGGDPRRRAAEQQRSAELLGADLISLAHPDGDLGPGLANQLSTLVDELGPDIVYTHRADEIHQDHIRTSQAVKVAARNIGSVLLFESPRSPALATGIFVDISEVFTEKLALVACHQSQTSRSRLLTEDAIRARAILHGIHAGVQLAELFEPVRLTWNIHSLSAGTERMDNVRDVDPVN